MNTSQSRHVKRAWLLAEFCGLLIILLGTLPLRTEAQTTTWVEGSVGPPSVYGFEFSLSGNGRWLAFISFDHLVSTDTNEWLDVYIRDLNSGDTELISRTQGGTAGNSASLSPSASADGRWVAFASFADNLISGDTNQVFDVFVNDRQTGIITRVSVPPGGGEFETDSFSPSISANGRWVAFGSLPSSLSVEGEIVAYEKIFVHDRQTGETTLVNVSTGGELANGMSYSLAISADGQWVAFSSQADNLVPGDTNASDDVFVHNRLTGETTRVSVATGGAQANQASGLPSINGDGRIVAFGSSASNLVSGDTNANGSGITFENGRDVFVHDRQTGQTTRVSVATGGGQGNGYSYGPSLSLDGRIVAFSSSADNLVSGDTNEHSDVFVHNRQTGQTTRVSVATGGGQANDFSAVPSLSAAGRRVAFVSYADNIVPGAPGIANYGVFVHDPDGFLPTNRGGSTDLDGNGTSDLLWRNTRTGSTAIWLLNGATIGSTGFPGGVPLAWQVAGIGDVNGDGKADVIWRHTTSATVAIWLMNGTTISSVGFPASVPTAWSLQAVGDLNGDDKADLVWRNSNDGNTAIWLMNGTRIAASGFLGKVSLNWQLAGLGDVSSDGKADLIWRNGTSHAVAIWVMNGLTMTSSGIPGNASPDLQFAGVGDVNGDGKTDLLWRNTSSGDVELWLLNGTAIASTGSLDGLSAQWQIEQVGDSDGDGKADVIWYNTTTGAVRCWLLNGLAIASEAFPGTVSTDWIIAGRPVAPPLSITTASTLPAGTVNKSYSITLAKFGGTPSFSWTVFSGSLPPGLTLNPSTGQISGTPTTAGKFLATIRVRDSGNPSQSAQELFSLTINSPPSPPPTSGGIGGTLTITGAPASVGGTFVANIGQTGKDPQQLLGSVVVGEGIYYNTPQEHQEVFGIVFNYTTGELSSTSFVAGPVPNITGWGCYGSYFPGLPTSVPGTCNGVTVNPSGGTANFSNTVLEDPDGLASPITVNGRLTFPPF